MSDKCPTCGSLVKIVGKTTKHYEPVDFKQRLIDAFHEHSNEYGRNPTYKESVDIVEMVFSDSMRP